MIDAKKYGPWAVIPGGSESLGRSFAQRLGDAGINLVLIARKQDALDEAAAEVRARSGVEVRTLSLDLARSHQFDRIREITDDLEVGLLVYNAGAAHRDAPFLEGSLGDALRMISVNAVGPVYLAHHFGAKMVARGRGGIITIGSFAGITGAPGLAVYSASKSFGQIFSEALWAEWKPHGVDVLHVPLGLMNSPAMMRMGVSFSPDQMPLDPDEHAGEILDNLPNGPVFVAPNLIKIFRHVQGLSRSAAVMQMTDLGRRLLARTGSAGTRRPPGSTAR